MSIYSINKTDKRKRTSLNEIMIDEENKIAKILLYNKNQEIVGCAIIDLKDVDRIKNIKWYLTTGNYVKNAKDGLFLHRIIADCPKGVEVDHINGNPLDNRRCNLRICEHKNNLKNLKISKRNTSGVKGVSWYKKYNKWKVRIVVNGKDIHLGYFENLEEAIEVRKKAEIEYFEEFRRK